MGGLEILTQKNGFRKVVYRHLCGTRHLETEEKFGPKTSYNYVKYYVEYERYWKVISPERRKKMLKMKMFKLELF